MNKLLIWDIDGTILDCKKNGRKALNYTFENMYGYKKAFENVDLFGKIDNEIIDEIVKKYKIEEFNKDDFLTSYGKILDLLLKNDETVEMLPGINDILDKIYSKKDYYLSIATGNCKIGAIEKLKRCKVDKYFKFGVYGDEVENRYELINQAIIESQKKYFVEFNKDDIYYIGDTPMDIKAAKFSNIRSISVATGYSKYNELKKHMPDYLFNNFNNFEELLKIFE